MTSRLRFRVVLPITMVALSALLMLHIPYQDWWIRGTGMGIITPAENLVRIVSGPAIYPLVPIPSPLPADWSSRYFHYWEQRLFGIGLLWFLVGLAIDRRRQGRDLAQELPTLAASLFAPLAIASLWLSYFFFSDLRRSGDTFWQILLPPYTLYTLTLGHTVLMLWCFFLGLYFFKKTVVAALILFRRT